MPPAWNDVRGMEGEQMPHAHDGSVAHTTAVSRGMPDLDEWGRTIVQFHFHGEPFHQNRDSDSLSEFKVLRFDFSESLPSEQGF